MDLVDFLVHFDQICVYERLELFEFLLLDADCGVDLLVHFLDDQEELLDLELLRLDLAVLVLDLTRSDVELRLELFVLCDTNNVLTDLNNLEMKLLIFDCLCSKLIL